MLKNEAKMNIYLYEIKKPKLTQLLMKWFINEMNVISKYSRLKGQKIEAWKKLMELTHATFTVLMEKVAEFL